MILGVAGLRPNFFSSGQIFLAELAQESWRDLAAVLTTLTQYCCDRQLGGTVYAGVIGSKWRSSVL